VEQPRRHSVATSCRQCRRIQPGVSRNALLEIGPNLAFSSELDEQLIHRPRSETMKPHDVIHDEAVAHRGPRHQESSAAVAMRSDQWHLDRVYHFDLPLEPSAGSHPADALAH
jgi:hypothetical protein